MKLRAIYELMPAQKFEKIHSSLYETRYSKSVAAPATKKWGDEGGGAPEKFLRRRPFFAGKRPFYGQGTPMFAAGGTLFKCNSTSRSSETVKILGFLMTNVANKAMSARYDSNETLLLIQI